MGAGLRHLRAVFSTIGLLAILLFASPATADALSKVRFLHAVPGAPDAELRLTSDRVPAVDLPSTGFAKASRYGDVAAGELRLRLRAGGKQVAEARERVQDGARYTVVATPGDGKAVRLRIYRDGDAGSGTARWRMVHAAAEVDDATVEVDGKDYGELSPGKATSYREAEPGEHELAIAQRGGGSALVSGDESLVAGTATTAYLVGSGGERTRFVLVQDDAAVPDQAPATGLGGLASTDTPWLAALLAAIGAGALGGCAYLVASARRRARA